MALPRFTDHAGNLKNVPLVDAAAGRPESYVLKFLERRRRDLGRTRSKVRILDVGCGRGLLTAWLCSEGWDAYGVDVDRNYISQGIGYFSGRGLGDDRLRLSTGTSLPFKRESFDVVLSDQVIEHVSDIDAFASGIAEVSGPGAVGLHIFPATRRVLEPHLKMPLVHWVPKGNPRRKVIRAYLAAGISVGHFRDYPLDERVEIFASFSDDETFYRPRKAVGAAFQSHGLQPDFRTPTRDRMAVKAPKAPPFLQVALGDVDSLIASTYLTTMKTA